MMAKAANMARRNEAKCSALRSIGIDHKARRRDDDETKTPTKTFSLGYGQSGCTERKMYLQAMERSPIKIYIDTIYIYFLTLNCFYSNRSISNFKPLYFRLTSEVS